MTAPRKRVVVIVLTSVLICLLTVIIGDYIHRTALVGQVEKEVSYIRKQLDREVMVHKFEALKALAGTDVVKNYLKQPVGEPEAVLSLLTGAQRSMRADIVYLMNTEGTVVVCSRYDNGKTLTDENYKIRPYFIQARAGEQCLYGALGLTTHRRGFYFSVPVVSEGGESVELVLVAKIGLDSVDALLSGSSATVSLKSPSGIIFSSNDSELMFRPAEELSDERLTEIRDSKQFSDKPLERLPFSLAGKELELGGQTQIVLRSDICVPDWELIAWSPYAFPTAWVMGVSSLALVVFWSCLGVVFGIRRRREMQQSLLLSKQDYEGIFNASADGIFIHDLETGKILEVNQRVCEMYGGTPEDYLDKTVAHISSEEGGYTLERARELIEAASGGDACLFEWYARRLDGSVFWVEVHLNQLQLKGERRVVAIVRDVNERHEQVDRLRKLSRAIEESPASVVITDVDGRIEYVNKAFSEVTGFTVEEAVGRTSRILSSGKHPKSFYQDMWSTITSGKIWTGEICNARRDKSLFWELARIAPILDDSGNPTHFVAVKVDISNLKATEEMLSEAKYAAEQADRAKSSFLANMSHEIRTPMNAIIGFLNLTLAESLPHHVRDNLNVVHQSAAELLVLIDNILDTSKLESGKMLLEDVQFSLKDVVNEVVSLFSPKAEQKGLTFEVKMFDTVAEGYVGDRGKIKQILSNLVDNAVKFTSSGGVTVTVAPRGDDRVLVEVRDTGIGIPPDKIDSVFVPFSQGDGSTTRRFGGTGLGTTISRQLVDLMGGRIWVRSKEGEGSEFSFEIPLLPIVARGVRGVEKREENPSAPMDTKELTVLMAEDVEINVVLAERWFSQTNYKLVVARDGLEAVDRFKEVKPDAVLMDVHMPRMDGVEAAREIRQLDGGATVPIIALTASVMKEEVDEYLNAGMDAVLGKPVDYPNLFNRVAELTGQRGGSGGKADLNEDDCPVALQGIVDWGDAMERWGDAELYLNSLNTFTVEQMKSLEAIETAIGKEDVEAACNRAHSLKGVLGNLSLSQCYESTLALEKRLRSGEMNAVSDLLVEVRALLQKAVDAARSVNQSGSDGNSG